MATVGLETGWTPDVIESLYCDDEDHKGLFFWVNQIIEKNKRENGK